ncbi:MAG: MotA/TolQ/ExbB proton channel family protein [Planctomycetota bacterium]
MDIGTIIGYALAWVAIIFGAWHCTHGDIGAYIKPTEVILVGGLAVGAAIAGTPVHAIMSAMKGFKKVLFGGHHSVDHTIEEIVEYAETARRDGVLALEDASKNHPDPFMRRGLQLTIDGTDPVVVERILRIEIDAMVERHKHGKHFFASVAKFGPGCGLLACLVAQIALFKNLNGSPDVIGAALAVALTGTLYGAMVQNIIAGPIADKLGLLSQEEAFGKEVMMQGLLSIQAGNNPRVVEMELLSFVGTQKQQAMMKDAA